MLRDTGDPSPQPGKSVVSARGSAERFRVALLSAGLVAINAAAWLWTWSVFAGRPVLLGTAVLAYAFGLRHAVDADHIAAIDNATRKLVEAGRRASVTGFFFSLGHGTVVIIAVLLIALASPTSLAPFQPLAGAVGTVISATALLVLALANTVILVAVYRLFRARKRGEPPDEHALTLLLSKRGLLGRVLRGFFRLITRSWHMYPLGFLFGLGFDTASEIGLLAMSAVQATEGLPLSAIMIFPALFTAGMALVDSADGLLMAGAYRWAAIEPQRKLYYNLAVTAVSVIVAVAIGGVELAGLIAGGDGSAGGFSSALVVFDEHSGAAGAGIIALFAALWVLSAVFWRRRATRV